MKKSSSDSSMKDERREHSRHSVLIKVALQDEKRLLNLYSTNLSRGGLFLSTGKGLPIGQTVIINLVHPINGANFEIEAEVVNVRKSKKGKVKGCGLRFTTFDEKIKKNLSLFVEGVIEPEGAPEEDIEIDAEEFETPPEPEEQPPEEDDDASANKLRANALLLKGLAQAKSGNLIGAAHLLARATSLDPTEEYLWTVLRDLESQLEEAAIEKESIEMPVSAEEIAQAAAESTEPANEYHDEEEPTIEEPLFETDRPSVPDPFLLDESEIIEEGVVELSEPALLEPSDRRKAKLLFEAARDCYTTEDFADAIIYLEKSLGADPSYAPTYYALAGLITEERQDYERGLFLCKKAVELEPNNDDYQEALESLEKLYKENQ